MSGVMAATAAGADIRVEIANAAVYALETGSMATAAYRLTALGSVDELVNMLPNSLSRWFSPPYPAAGAFYEARATMVSGALSGGTTGSWLGLGSDREWTVQRNSAGTSVAQFTLEIRHAGSGVVLDTATIDLEAEYV